MPTFDSKNNFAYETVTTAPSPGTSGTTIVIGTTNFAQFPDPSSAPYNVVAWPAGTIPLASNAEILRVVTKGTNGTVEVTRAQESSTNRDIGVGDQFAMNITAKSISDIENYLNNTSTGAELNAPTIGTATITGGTATNTVLNTNTVGTPAITGGTATSTVLNNNTIGTPNITDGTADFQSLDINTTTAATAILDQDDMSANSAAAIPTQQSVKAYVDNNPSVIRQVVSAYSGSALTNTTSGAWTDMTDMSVNVVVLSGSRLIVNATCGVSTEGASKRVGVQLVVAGGTTNTIYPSGSKTDPGGNASLAAIAYRSGTQSAGTVNVKLQWLDVDAGTAHAVSRSMVVMEEVA